MATHGDAVFSSYEVTEDLSAKKYFAVKLGATDFRVLLSSVAGAPIVGILAEEIDGSSNAKHAQIATGGRFKLKITDTIADNGLITIHSDGTGKAATGTNKQAPFRAAQAGVTGDVIEVQFTWENTGN
jgi:hypothetical protein